MEFKTCTKCKVEKPTAEFSANTKGKDGLQAKCKACDSARYQANKAHTRLVQAKYYENNREKVLTHQKINRARTRHSVRKWHRKQISNLSDYYIRHLIERRSCGIFISDTDFIDAKRFLLRVKRLIKEKRK